MTLVLRKGAPIVQRFGIPFFPDPRDGYALSNEFTDQAIGTYAVTATGTNTISASVTGRPGLLTQGVTAVGDRASWILDPQVRSFLGGGGAITCEGSAQLPTLSDGVNNILYQLGLGDAPAPGDQVDAILFENDRSTNGSNNWFLLTASNSVRTRTDLGVAPTAAVYDRLRWEMAVDGSSVVAKVNDAIRATVTTNIPIAAGRNCGPHVRAVKQLGAGALSAITDYYDLRQLFSTRR